MKVKTERLSVTLLERDKRALEQLAKREGEAMTVVVRRLIRTATVEQEQLVTAGGNHADRR